MKSGNFVARLWFWTGAFVRSRIERIVEPSFVIKGGCAERFWTVIVFKDAATRGATEGLSSSLLLGLACFRQEG